MRLRRRLGTIAFDATTWLLFAFVVFPVVVVVGTSVSGTPDIGFPPETVSLEYYRQFLFVEAKWQEAFFNSVVVAAGTTVLATALGTAGAYGVHNLPDGRLKRAVSTLVVLPLPTPLIVLALALSVYFAWLNMLGSYLAIVFGHTLVAIPFVYFVMRAVLSRVDWETRAAARDLGASPWQAFREAVFPQVRAGLLASTFVAAVLSLHEFLIAFFVSGFDTRTLPVLEWNALRNFIDPMVSVVSTLLVFAALALLVPAVLLVGVDRLARQL